MINIEIYADTTGQYSESELNYCNGVAIDVPRWIVEKYFEKYLAPYEREDGEIINFDTWYREEYTCDELLDLYEFCKENGFTPVCGKKCNGWVWFN